MGRRKKNDGSGSKQRLDDVGHGCVDCIAYDVPMQKSPCKMCKGFSYWEPGEKYAESMKKREETEERLFGKKKKREVERH